MKVQARFEYSGMIDYWGGEGRRWDDDAGCLFATYDHKTKLRDIVEQWINDFNSGGDCDTFPEAVTEADVRKAIIAMLSEEGRLAYKYNLVSEFSEDYAAANGLSTDDTADTDIECDELPVAIILLEIVE